MALLCFLLDLRSLRHSILVELKQILYLESMSSLLIASRISGGVPCQTLLQIANLYAILESSSSRSKSESGRLRDRIGLCYVSRNCLSSDNELKIAYSPSGDFNLLDFYNAVDNLPLDAYLPEIDDSEAFSRYDIELSNVLSDQVLYSWGGKDVMKKVIVLSSSVPQDVDSVMQRTFMDAAAMRTSFEFVLFENKSSHSDVLLESVFSFLTSISDIENCAFQAHPPDTRVFQVLVSRCLEDLKDDVKEPLQARFSFKSNLAGTVNQIFCNLYMPVNKMIDKFAPSEACRCHGIPLEENSRKRIKEPSYPVTGCDLEDSDLIENSVKVGERTILLSSSFQYYHEFQQVPSQINFTVIERTSLGSLSESVMMGDPYVVVPSSSYETDSASDHIDGLELNAQVFQALCGALQSMDQGLVCISNCNMEMLKDITFPCYYILQPSDGGPMLLRRLAGSEEVLYVPDLNKSVNASVSEEIENSVRATLEKEVELKVYDPLLHVRGFHQKLNLMVKENLQLSTSHPQAKEEATSKANSSQPNSFRIAIKSSSVKETVNDVKDEENFLDLTEEYGRESRVTQEWEQLAVVHKLPKIYSMVHESEVANLDQLKKDELSPDCKKQIDEKTSRILERLEAPRQSRTKSVPIEKPPSSLFDQGSTSSQQLMKPIFNKLKRKHK